MDIVRQSLAITLVFALLAAAMWALRKKGAIRLGARQARGGMLESRAKLVLSQQHVLHVVRIGQQDVVLALHPSGVTLLAELPCGLPSTEHRTAGAEP
jgi:flagellar biogenesis protein FliO